MQNKTNRNIPSWGTPFTVLFFVLCSAGVLFLSKSILVPFLLSLLLAYAFDPLVDILESKKIPRPISIGLIFALIVLSLILILFFVLPTLQDQLTRTFKQLPSYLNHLHQEVVPALEKRFGVRFPATFEETLKPIMAQLKNEAPALFKPVTTFALNFFTNTFGVFAAIANLIIIPFMFYYLLKDFDRIKEKLTGYIPLKYREETFKRIREIDTSLSGFIRGQLLVILFLSVLYVAGLSWIGIDLSFPLGFIAAAGEIVPYIGFAFGLTLALAFALLQFQDLIHPLYVLLLFGGIQALQGLAIAPLIMGKEVGLHPLTIVAAVYIGGDLFGFIGVLLAVPGAAIFVVLLKALLEYYRNSSLFREPSE